ncbi:Fe-Mn family superoxide dismutase [Luteimonas abyssi]|uniref:Fe-Mn family superoxide dismutase n=1 Tax=Luteimonas abyssi TaxID=1247514 RepID=UPI000737C00A|nr:Fe-Mn family superoxide dismutase [Luteimonas abyssi]
MPIETAALPYDRTALEPHLSGDAVEQHYALLVADIERVNALVAGGPLADASLEDVVRQAQGRLFEHAAQAWNTDLYWRCLQPPAAGGNSEPAGRLAEALTAGFDDFAGFRRQFEAIALRGFGAGWVWLLQRTDGRLAIAATANAATPLTGPDRPLLACSLWQHAYYLDYQDQREKYLAAWWQLVNWRYVASRMAKPAA